MDLCNNLLDLEMYHVHDNFFNIRELLLFGMMSSNENKHVPTLEKFHKNDLNRNKCVVDTVIGNEQFHSV